MSKWMCFAGCVSLYKTAFVLGTIMLSQSSMFHHSDCRIMLSVSVFINGFEFCGQFFCFFFILSPCDVLTLVFPYCPFLSASMATAKDFPGTTTGKYFLLECWHHHCETGRCNVACGVLGRVTPINLLHSMSWEPLPCMGALLIFVKCHGAPWCCHSHKGCLKLWHTYWCQWKEIHLISVRKNLEKLEMQFILWRVNGTRIGLYQMTKREYVFNF